MSRVTNSPATRARRKRVLKKAKGYFGLKSRAYTHANDAVNRAQKYAYAHRRKKKSDFRGLWIVRINAACRALGVTYSRLVAGLRKANIVIDRKNLSELAIHDEAAFAAIVEKAKQALA
ncbi:MAG: 50S ribosomal protein L20 [Opitutae bacterium]|nr:50S ribosomal protein L20 [Opitutae bacterium]MCD8298709.1 50S ribosomal protein L20 [Opitutae bacterium]